MPYLMALIWLYKKENLVIMNSQVQENRWWSNVFVDLKRTTAGASLMGQNIDIGCDQLDETAYGDWLLFPGRCRSGENNSTGRHQKLEKVPILSLILYWRPTRKPRTYRSHIRPLEAVVWKENPTGGELQWKNCRGSLKSTAQKPQNWASLCCWSEVLFIVVFPNLAANKACLAAM